ncbi:MAG: hypothetical protein JW797_05955 [Bradymonadales bacterium]|nr:hypothetical protein [Bradymonadales bacterium]
MHEDLDTAIRLLLSRRTRDTYLAEAEVTPPTEPLPLGQVILPSYEVLQTLAHNMNLRRDLREDPGGAVRPGELNAFSLLTEAMEVLIEHYREEVAPAVFEQWDETLGEAVGEANRDQLLVQIAQTFPFSPPGGETSVEQYLNQVHGNLSNRQRALVTFLLAWVSGENPTSRPFREIFEVDQLAHMGPFEELVEATDRYFAQQPPISPEEQTLVEMLLAPVRHAPSSLFEQLEFIIGQWRRFLPERLVRRLLLARDRLREEWKWAGPPTQAGPAEAPRFEGELRPVEAGRFARESSWKPRMILMAKNVRVWLDQLSKQYQRPLTRLDEIPDEVLERLARWGFSGLWLIGLWERSPASQQIKQLMGNPEALGSAYSLYDYQIADDLGGDEALDRLKERTDRLGIRLAADMVPNHVGILSRWVIEHPDWFVSLSYPPFPSYRFEGPDLSNHPEIGLFLEDGYWNRTDAAVVFKRLDRRTGQALYLYHGNDGTQMPWNDTAQLDFRKPEVRQAVIEVILRVLQRFSFLRFDAAMTLTRFHYQRLWFPEPGAGAAIPSRAEHGMSWNEFQQAMPQEFWREVVDAVGAQAPDSLLMAEAFWLTEEFFIRTLGMHRVYNSAFMNMLRNEDNAKYRQMIKEILTSDPEVLYQLVNFMTNPDEQTAIDGFGKGDKYFGILTTLVTLPGLPMFGHGQIEGFTEKYGMEFHRAYWDEQPDPQLVRRHEEEIFPLMRQRDLFAPVEHFQLYDFYREDGSVDENVFAFSNRSGDQAALVLYNNRLESTQGTIHRSVPKIHWTTAGAQQRQVTLAEALGLDGNTTDMVQAYEHRTRSEQRFPVSQLHTSGLKVHLPGYQCRIFTGFRP